MKTFQYILNISVIFIYFGVFGQEFPKSKISNGLITASIYLPNPDHGYYRATRFDWSGVIPQLEYNGHTYFGQWFENYDPLNHESVMGPVDEFSQIGYDETDVGETFLKIGVGTLIKPTASKYNKFKQYEIKNGGTWTTTSTPEKVVFKHALIDDKYSYSYEKQVQLAIGKPEMIIRHTLTNNSNHIFKTQVYNHNFFLIDHQPIGKGYAVIFPHKIDAQGILKGINQFAKISNNEIIFTNNIPNGKQVYIQSVKGYNSQSEQYEFSIENRITGAGVKVVGNNPLASMTFWSASKTICPEPFTDIYIAPGKTTTWDIRYTFYKL